MGDAEAAATLITDVHGYESTLLELEAPASAAYHRFLFDSDAEARTFRAFLLAKGAAEYAPPAVRLLLVHGEPAGLLAVLPAELVRKRRIAAMLAVSRDPRYSADSTLHQRLQLAARVLHKVREDEAYLARMAVSDRFAGRGLGRWLLRQAFAVAHRHGLHRLVLDVAADNERALELYEKSAFVEVGRASVTDPDTGRSLDYRHLLADVPAEP